MRFPADGRKTRLLVYCEAGGSGGYLRYCAGLLAESRIPDDFEVCVVAPSALLESLPSIDSRLTVVEADAMASAFRMARYLWHLVKYPLLARRFDADVEFFPAGRVRQLWRQTIAITTCHNLLLFDEDEISRYKKSSARRRYRTWRRVQAASFSRASGVIFLSRHSRDVVEKTMRHVRPAAVIGHGVDEEFRVQRTSYELSAKPRLLYVSSVHPYKNHATVVRAMGLVRARTGLDAQVEFIGPGETDTLRELRELVKQCGASGYVTLRGAVSDDVLIGAYREADVFVFTSSCETFGISLLEAMAGGLPIVCSNKAGLSDLVGDAAEYCDPFDEVSVSDAICRVVASHDFREKLGRAAALRAAEFTWTRAAQETYSFIRDAYRASLS